MFLYALYGSKPYFSGITSRSEKKTVAQPFRGFGGNGWEELALDAAKTGAFWFFLSRG